MNLMNVSVSQKTRKTCGNERRTGDNVRTQAGKSASENGLQNGFTAGIRQDFAADSTKERRFRQSEIYEKARQI
jgi:hypothetical protein